MNHSDLGRVIDFLRGRIPTLRAVYLFGSQSRAEAGPESDVDLAFLADKPPDMAERHRLASELAELLHREVDLVDFAAASTVLRAQVIGRGRRIAGGPDVALEEFESRVLSDYARLNEERAAILNDIEQRGSVHG